jgi:hypothetical protein
MPLFLRPLAHAIVIFSLSLCPSVSAADEAALALSSPRPRGWRTGDLVPVTCLNRTMYVAVAVSTVDGGSF